MLTIFFIVLILMLLASVPAWGYSRDWGYYPSGLIGTILLILVIMMLLGQV